MSTYLLVTGSLLIRQDERPQDMVKIQPGAWSLTFALFGIAVVVVLARLAARAYYKHFGIDDALMILALICTTIFVSCFYTLVQSIDTPDFSYTRTHEFCLDIVHSVNYAFSMCLAKLSALLFLRRIGRHAFGRISDYIIWADVVWTLLGALQLSFFQIFACRPLSALGTCWKDATPGSCIDYKPSVFAYSLNLLVGNIPLIVMPALLVVRLQMPLRKKILMFSVPLLTVIDTAITCFRMLRYAERIWPSIKTNFSGHYFYGYDSALTPIEVFLALITASLPMLYRPGKNLCRYFKAAVQTRSLRPGTTLGSSGMNTSGPYPSALRQGSGSAGHMRRVGGAIRSAPRRVKEEIYQLATVNREGPSSSTERVMVRVGAADDAKRARSVASDDEDEPWRHGH